MTTFMLFTAVSALLGASVPCQTTTGLDAAALLHRAADRIGLSRSGGTVLKTVAFDVRSHGYESDRMYPPVLAEVARLDHWFDPEKGVERVTSDATLGGYEFVVGSVGDSRASYSLRDTTLIPNEETHSAMYETRPLNAWAVLDDWMKASDVRVE
jgi:hypothetical protein